MYNAKLLLLTGFACAFLLTSCSTIPILRGPVFPDAAGFNPNLRAGRGGKVLRVTNLNSEGPGSLRDALMVEGPRIIVFEVGGVIDLKKKDLIIAYPFLTVAGQTAPSPGITIIRGQLGIGTHDVVIRHIRIRPGDAGLTKADYWSPDGILAHGALAYNIIIDHCSITWAIDENLSTTGSTSGPKASSRRVTFSNCIIAEGLRSATHSKGNHSMGALIYDFCREIAFIGNLFAHNYSRNPYFKARTTGVIVNNVIYNPGRTAIQLWWHPSEWVNAKYQPENGRVSIVGNVYFQGADTQPGLAMVTSLGDAYLEDNLAFDREGNPARLFSGKINVLKRKPVWPRGLKPLPVGDVMGYIVRHAGARPRDRDKTDRRIIRDLQARKGRIIDSQEQVGGYPQDLPTRRKLDIPEENLEEWLESFTKEVE